MTNSTMPVKIAQIFRWVGYVTNYIENKSVVAELLTRMNELPKQVPKVIDHRTNYDHF